MHNVILNFTRKDRVTFSFEIFDQVARCRLARTLELSLSFAVRNSEVN